MSGERRVSPAWQYFLKVDGGAQCQIDGCSHAFLKRAYGSSTKFLWSHLESHHRTLAMGLGRTIKKRNRSKKNNASLFPATNGKTEVVDIHCYPPSISPTFLYTQNNIPTSSSTTMTNLMDLITNDASTNNINEISDLSPEEPILSVNEYFCKMLCAQLNQMSEKQAHITREKIQSIVGRVLYEEQKSKIGHPPPFPGCS